MEYSQSFSPLHVWATGVKCEYMSVCVCVC